MNLRGDRNPLVRVVCGLKTGHHSMRETGHHAKGGANPVWKDEHHLQGFQGFQRHGKDEETISISLWDFNHVSHNEYVGGSRVNMSQFFAQPSEDVPVKTMLWTQGHEGKGVGCGTLHLLIKWQPATEEEKERRIKNLHSVASSLNEGDESPTALGFELAAGGDFYITAVRAENLDVRLPLC